METTILLLLSSFLLLLLSSTSPPNVVAQSSSLAPVSKPGCPTTCANLTVPYPFGTTDGCYLEDKFFINCNATTNGTTTETTYTPLLGTGNLRVLNISLEGELRVASWSSVDCYNDMGASTSRIEAWTRTGKFYVSSTRNKFVAIGCDTFAVIRGMLGQKYTTGCMSLCGNMNSLNNGSCLGIGCCQTSIPDGVRDFNLSVTSFSNHQGITDFNPCSYGFVVENGEYEFSTLDLLALQTIPQRRVPVVFDWAVGNLTCNEAKKNQTSYACKDIKSYCVESINGPGYRCNCSSGYRGNPYLEQGCIDIDECDDSNPLHDCVSNENCRNTNGGFECFCPKGYRGDGKQDGQRCTRRQSKWTKVIVGSSVAVAFLFASISFVYCGIQRKNKSKLKEKNFKENGGLILQQLLSKIEHSDDRTKIFTEEEMKKATDNFNKANIVGEGGFGTVYEGTLGQNIQVAIKKSKLVDRDQIDQFVNEVIVLSQIKHPNVVKLLGICLETQVPLLVYEFITNKTLHHHLHNEDRESNIPWQSRLRIAVETASALAHMHVDAPMHIIHRDVKSANILLTDKFTAKVADFGMSRLVPLDQTRLATVVQGTFGYVDPEYFQSGVLTDKSDVYSFGVVLVELLTGEPAFSPEKPENEKSLAMSFNSAMKDNDLGRIVDIEIKKDVHEKAQYLAAAEIARRCLKLHGDERPTMKEVKMGLEEIFKGGKSFQAASVSLFVETQPAHGPPEAPPMVFTDNSFSMGSDNMKAQAFTHIATGR